MLYVFVRAYIEMLQCWIWVKVEYLLQESNNYEHSNVYINKRAQNQVKV